MNIPRDRYPERLRRAFVINVPFPNAFYKIINPLIDPITRAKLKFDPSCVKEGHFEPDMLVKENWGGDRTLEYVHEKFWPALLGLTGERRESQMERWRRLGEEIRVKEWDYKVEIEISDTEEEVEEKGEEVIETSVAIAVQA